MSRAKVSAQVPTLPEQTRIELPGGPTAPGAGRQAVLERLPRELDSRTRETVELLVSELVTNAVRHGGASERETIALRIGLGPECLGVEVVDHGPGFDARPAEPDDDGGYGLVILDLLASRWGFTNEGRTSVWFEVDRAPPQQG